MRTVDIFASVAIQAAQDSNVHKYGAFIVRNGFKSIGKFNPTLVWIDAGLAVIDACNAYFQYRAACAVTEQLREQNRALERLLAQELQLAEMELRSLMAQRKAEQAQYHRVLQEITGREQLTARKIREKMALLKKIHALLDAQRQQSGNFRQLIDLQVAVDTCLDACLTLMLETTAV